MIYSDVRVEIVLGTMFDFEFFALKPGVLANDWAYLRPNYIVTIEFAHDCSVHDHDRCDAIAVLPQSHTLIAIASTVLARLV